jgi:hypothetical protein
MLFYIAFFYGSKLFYKQRAITQLKKRANNYLMWYNVLLRWVENAQKGKTIGSYLLSRGYRKIAVYGLGDICDLICETLKESEIRIVFLINEDSSKIQEKSLPIIGIEKMTEYKKVDAIVVVKIDEYTAILKKIREINPKIDVISLDAIILSI